MNDTLRPSTLGEILDRTAQLYRRNFWLFVGTAALPLVLIFALVIPFVAFFATKGDTWLDDPSTILSFLLLLPIALLVYLAIYVFSYAGITQAAVNVHRGEKPTFRGTLSSVTPRFWTYLGYILLKWIFAAFIPSFIAFALIAPLIFLVSRPGGDLASRSALVFLAVVLGAAALGAMIWLRLGYAMGMAVCVAEKKTAWESLMRSWRLSPGTRGRIFVTWLLVIALAIGIMIALAIPLLILIAVLPSTRSGSVNSQAAFVVMEIVRVVLDFCTRVLLAPIFIIAAVLFYYDQRIRKEGYDIEWMMQQAGLTPLQAPSGTVWIPGGAQPPSAAPQAGGTGIFPPVIPPDNVGER